MIHMRLWEIVSLIIRADQKQQDTKRIDLKEYESNLNEHGTGIQRLWLLLN